jgi:hypothetical protein
VHHTWSRPANDVTAWWNLCHVWNIYIAGCWFFGFQELARRLQQEQQTVASERLHVSALTIQNRDLQTELVAANQKIYGGWVSMNSLSLLHALYSYWICCLVMWLKWTDSNLVMGIKYSVW